MLYTSAKKSNRMENSRTSSRSSTFSPKMYTFMAESTPRDHSDMGQLGRQEPSLFSGRAGRHRQQLAPDSSVFQMQRASPFKQAVQGSRLQVKKLDREQTARRQTHPGESLMARTEQSVELVRQQILVDEATPSAGRKSGRLQKGHLQPMRLARVHGPPIQQCCGIMPQKAISTFGVTATIQRHGQIIANLDTTREMYQSLANQYAAAAASSAVIGAGVKSGSNPVGRYRPDTSESVHRTSVASEEELGDDIDDELDELRGPSDGAV